MEFSRYNIWVEDVGNVGNKDKFYLFNGMSGGLIRLSAEERRGVEAFIEGQDDVPCSPKLLEQLVLGRMLLPGGTNEIASLAKTYEQSQSDRTHFTLTMVTSLGCNFDCPYCFEAKHPSIMDEDVQAAVLRVVDDQIPKIRSLFVSWFGGEPLVGKKPLLALADAFIDRCDRAGVEYNSQITTNGYLLTEQTCAELRDRRVRSAQVGLDGPPEIHDKMRPLANGKGTFWTIVKNLQHAVKYVPIVVRVNVDMNNFDNAEELFKILAAEGLAGKLTVYPGQLVGMGDFAAAPSASYQGRCFSNKQFAAAELAFLDLAAQYGLASPTLPSPMGAPCTAVRANELVVGSKGELYKCWDSVGNVSEVTGNIREYDQPNGRLQKWLKYDPFSNAECCDCIALPVCMGGCAHHAMDVMQYDNRCGTFRHTYKERVISYARALESGLVVLNKRPEAAPSMSTR